MKSKDGMERGREEDRGGEGGRDLMMHECLVEEPLGEHLCARRRRRRGESLTASKLKSKRLDGGVLAWKKTEWAWAVVGANWASMGPERVGTRSSGLL